MERSTIYYGKIHYFYGHFQLQTVSSPEGKSIHIHPHSMVLALAKPRLLSGLPGKAANMWLQPKKRKKKMQWFGYMLNNPSKTLPSPEKKWIDVNRSFVSKDFNI